MPKARAYDGGHTVFTDHSIPRRALSQPVLRANPGVPAELAPYFHRELPPGVAARNLGLAYTSIADQFNVPDFDKRAWPLLVNAAQSNVRDPLLYTQMAYLLQADGRFEQAIELYRLSLKLDPDQDLAVVNLGELLYRRGDKDEARRLWRRALILNPRQPAVRLALARP
jgi:tetratricopeptide (TPR) repeat protein